MDCIGCGSTAVTERPDLTAQGYHRFRCRDCGKQFNERSDVCRLGQHGRVTVCWCFWIDPVAPSPCNSNQFGHGVCIGPKSCPHYFVEVCSPTRNLCSKGLRGTQQRDKVGR